MGSGGLIYPPRYLTNVMVITKTFLEAAVLVLLMGVF
jgi:hypothetical protein